MTKPRGRPPIQDDKLPIDKIINDYTKLGLSLMDIAAKYGCSDMTVYNRLKNAGVTTRSRYRQENKRIRARLRPENEEQFRKDVALHLYEKRNPYEISMYTRVSIKDVIKEVNRQCSQSKKNQSDEHTMQ